MTIDQELTTIRLTEIERRLGSLDVWYRNEWKSMEDAAHHEVRLRRARGRAGIAATQPACCPGHYHAGSRP